MVVAFAQGICQNNLAQREQIATQLTASQVTAEPGVNPGLEGKVRCPLLRRVGASLSTDPIDAPNE